MVKFFCDSCGQERGAADMNPGGLKANVSLELHSQVVCANSPTPKIAFITTTQIGEIADGKHICVQCIVAGMANAILTERTKTQ